MLPLQSEDALVAALLLSWLPVIGDPRTIAAGAVRAPLRWFLPLVVVAKTG